MRAPKQRPGASPGMTRKDQIDSGKSRQQNRENANFSTAKSSDGRRIDMVEFEAAARLRARAATRAKGQAMKEREKGMMRNAEQRRQRKKQKREKYGGVETMER